MKIPKYHGISSSQPLVEGEEEGEEGREVGKEGREGRLSPLGVRDVGSSAGRKAKEKYESCRGNGKRCNGSESYLTAGSRGELLCVRIS